MRWPPRSWRSASPGVHPATALALWPARRTAAAHLRSPLDETRVPTVVVPSATLRTCPPIEAKAPLDYSARRKPPITARAGHPRRPAPTPVRRLAPVEACLSALTSASIPTRLRTVRPSPGHISARAGASTGLDAGAADGYSISSDPPGCV